MRVLIATDAWFPQINGVVRTLSSLAAELGRRGVDVLVVSPHDFRTIPCPTYPEVRLALASASRVGAMIAGFDPDVIHIATEGLIGFQTRRVALREERPFTTSFHTRFPEYLRQRVPVPTRLTYAWLRRFHAPATACLVPTETVRRDLLQRGFNKLRTWTRGVDRDQFRPCEPIELRLPRPVFITVSRLAPEKNLEAFLELDLPGSKLVVGDGPSLGELKRRYPGVRFAGAQTGDALARHYCAGDVFVFPSKTDTFGIVLIEALACGVPVAAFPEPGPIDVLAGTEAGCMSEDLRSACLAALSVSREAALARSRAFSWEACADTFLDAASRSGSNPASFRLSLAG